MNADYLIHELRKRGTEEVIETISSSLTEQQERRFLRKYMARLTHVLEQGKLRRGHIVECLLRAHEYAVEAVDVQQPEGRCHKCGSPVTPEHIVLGTEIELHGACPKCNNKESL